MKTISMVCLLFLWTCNKPLPNLTPDFDLPCPYPSFKPPPIVPGTNCLESCQYIYEGWVNFQSGLLNINCGDFPLECDQWSWDHRYQYGSTCVTEGYFPIFRIQTPGFSSWCKRYFLFQVSDYEMSVSTISTITQGNTGEVRLIMKEGFWDCYPGPGYSLPLRYQIAFELQNLAICI